MKLICSRCSTALIIEPKLQTEEEYRVRPCEVCLMDSELIAIKKGRKEVYERIELGLYD